MDDGRDDPRLNVNDEPDFTMGDLLQELKEQFGFIGQGELDSEGLYTSQELADFFNVNQATVRRRLRRLKKQGRLDDLQRKWVTSGLGNVPIMVPAYRLIERKDNEDVGKDQGSIYRG